MQRRLLLSYAWLLDFGKQRMRNPLLVSIAGATEAASEKDFPAGARLELAKDVYGDQEAEECNFLTLKKIDTSPIFGFQPARNAAVPEPARRKV